MDQTMITRWNRVVKPDDDVYHLGDVGWFGSKRNASIFLSRLNGRIHLIAGNHDDSHVLNLDRFESVQDYRVLRTDKHKIVLFHYPIWEWHHAHKGAWHLYGHVHGNPTPMMGKCWDVSVDNNDFTPVSYDQLLEKW